MEELKKECEDFMEFLKSEDYHEDKLDDYKNAIFEAAMETVFDDRIWEVVNAHIE